MCAAGGGEQGPDSDVRKKITSLEDRIASGEFTDAGSTKERLTRPLRRLLAKDPLGPGARRGCGWSVGAAGPTRWLCLPRCRVLLQAADRGWREETSCGLLLLAWAHACAPRAALATHVTAGRALSLQLAKIGKGWQREAAERMPTATGDIREIVGQPVFVPLFKLYQVRRRRRRGWGGWWVAGLAGLYGRRQERGCGWGLGARWAAQLRFRLPLCRRFTAPSSSSALAPKTL